MHNILRPTQYICTFTNGCLRNVETGWWQMKSYVHRWRNIFKLPECSRVHASHTMPLIQFSRSATVVSRQKRCTILKGRSCRWCVSLYIDCDCELDSNRSISGAVPWRRTSVETNKQTVTMRIYFAAVDGWSLLGRCSFVIILLSSFSRMITLLLPFAAKLASCLKLLHNPLEKNRKNYMML